MLKEHIKRYDQLTHKFTLSEAMEILNKLIQALENLGGNLSHEQRVQNMATDRD